MTIFKKFKNLLTSNALNQAKVKPIDMFLSLIQQEPKDENKILNLIEKENLLDSLLADELNYAVIDKYKVNALMHCINTHQFKVATHLLKKEGVKIDIELNTETALNKAFRYLFLEESHVFFDELFSKKRSYNANIYPLLEFVLLDAPNGEFVSKFLNTFDVNVANKIFFGDDLLGYLQEREELPLYSLKAVLNTNKFNQERLEKMLASPIHPSEIDCFRSTIEEKIKEIIKQNRDNLDELLTHPTEKTKTKNKAKI